MNKTITIRYGATTMTQEVSATTTFGEVIENDDYRAVFGWGDNVQALISGVVQTSDTGVPAGATVVIETRCNTKA